MKISGIKFGVNIDVGEFDIDLKDVLDIQRLNYEHSRELRKECSTEHRINELQKAGPSASTKEFVEMIVGKAVEGLKAQIVEAIKSKGKKNKDDGDEN